MVPLYDMRVYDSDCGKAYLLREHEAIKQVNINSFVPIDEQRSKNKIGKTLLITTWPAVYLYTS